MDSVFKHFNVCEDVSNMIAMKVHDGYQKEVNDHISVMVAWDRDYDYWKISGDRVGSSFLLDRGDRYRHDDLYDTDKMGCLGNEKRLLSDKDRESIAKKLDVIALYDRHYSTKKTSAKLPNEQYMKYIFSGKRIFALDGITRFLYMWTFVYSKMRFYVSENCKSAIPMAACHILGVTSIHSRFGATQRWPSHPIHIQQGRIAFLQDLINIHRFQESQVLMCLRKHDKTYHKLDDQKFLDDPVMHRIYYPHSKKITKKGLHAYLAQNGEKRKLTHKSKKELWKMVIELK